ncbi:hypothetical protein GK047_29015 [Paenibacillus sp. SYP-B3998]|uniref:Uncharacterized protein n=1 Tax=Paenibacillus sp. SYP-B3998 TaxID=2678564 RepID=A0A6G4A8H7_9BACL|nr:hypothetical protein [Paenibacillus sp. SYP-B3998]NEW09927.1 hypothetical protein [Paenibacillus sp. SYP-B3998]
MIRQFSRSLKLQNILKTIKSDPFRYSDEEIITHVDKYLPSYNCEGAARGYFSIISHICYYRSDLEKQLMKLAVKPLYYLGISDPDSQIKWVQSYVKERKIFGKNYKYYTTRQGRKWIINELKFKHELIENIIKAIDFEDSVEDSL